MLVTLGSQLIRQIAAKSLIFALVITLNNMKVESFKQLRTLDWSIGSHAAILRLKLADETFQSILIHASESLNLDKWIVWVSLIKMLIDDTCCLCLLSTLWIFCTLTCITLGQCKEPLFGFVLTRLPHLFKQHLQVYLLLWVIIEKDSQIDQLDLDWVIVVS